MQINLVYEKSSYLCVYLCAQTQQNYNNVTTNELAKHLNELSDNLLLPTSHVHNMECLEVFSLPSYSVYGRIEQLKG